MTAARLVVPLLLVTLWLIFFLGLRRAAYGSRTSVAVSTVSIAQAGLLLSAATGGSGLWFALAIAAVASSAIAFAERQHDARFIVALGGSLGAVQLADPSGGIVAAFVLPMLAGLQRGGLARASGLFVLLLFIPCLFAAGLAYASADRHINAAQWLAHLSHTDWMSWPPVGGRTQVTPASFLFFLPALPVFALIAMKTRSKPFWALAAVALAVAFAAFVAMVLRIVRNPVDFIAALAPVSPAALCLLPAEGGRELRALLASLASTALSWLVACGAWIPAG